MARTAQRIRFLTLVDLEIEVSPSEETSRTVRQTVEKAIPDQVDSPILTDIDDDRLVTRPGRTIDRTAPIAHVSQYLAEQYEAVASDLEAANTDRKIVAFFREAVSLLQDWSITKLLSFGAHLYLLESSVGPLKQELSAAVANRVDAVVLNSRRFINNFEEWHAFVRQSIVLDIETGELGTEVITITNTAAAVLAQEHETVDPQIPQALTKFADIASRSERNQGVAVGIMSALRSFTNISISFVNYVSNKSRIAARALGNPAISLLRTICRFLPLALRLAAARPDLSWLLNHSGDIEAMCKSIKDEEKVR